MAKPPCPSCGAPHEVTSQRCSYCLTTYTGKHAKVPKRVRHQFENYGYSELGGVAQFLVAIAGTPAVIAVFFKIMIYIMFSR